MSPRLVVGATLVSALGSGLIGGVFFAFSSFVMGALGRLPTAQGVAAMQSINVVVINPWFLVPFVGTALVCGLLAVVGLFVRPGPGSAFLWIGGLLYVLGTFGVTMFCNVPRNNLLAGVDPASPDAAPIWSAYLASWTFWNHVRAAAAMAAAALLTVGLLRR